MWKCFEEDEKEEDKLTEAEIYSEEFANEFVESMDEIFLKDQETINLLTMQCGEGVIEFIDKSLSIFKVHVSKNYWNKSE